MNIRLGLAKIYVPRYLKKKKVTQLFEMSARAFQAEMPETKGLTLEDRLKTYAEWTKDQAERILRENRDGEASREKLYQNALKLGLETRRRLNVRNREEFLAAARILYKILNIDFQGSVGGDIIVRKCYFSLFYTSEVCRLMAALDEGILAGLAGGGRLDFRQRLSEGKECCLAHFRFEEFAP